MRFLLPCGSFYLRGFRVARVPDLIGTLSQKTPALAFSAPRAVTSPQPPDRTRAAGYAGYGWSDLSAGYSAAPATLAIIYPRILTIVDT